MKKIIFGFTLLLNGSLFAATLNLSGIVPEGVKLTELSAYYKPVNPVYGCMGGEYKLGKISTNGKKFSALINYSSEIGGMFCKKKLSSLTLSYKVERLEGKVLQTEDQIGSHELTFGIKGTRPVLVPSLNVTCKREGERVFEGAYDVNIVKGISKCSEDKIVNVPLKGNSQVNGILFNIIGMEPMNLEAHNLDQVINFENQGISLELYKNAAGYMGPLSVVKVTLAPAGSQLRPGTYRVRETLVHKDGTVLKISAGGHHINQKDEVSFDVTTLNADPRLFQRQVEFDQFKCKPEELKALLISQQDLDRNWTRSIYCSK